MAVILRSDMRRALQTAGKLPFTRQTAVGQQGADGARMAEQMTVVRLIQV